jgi:hypothetical protein
MVLSQPASLLGACLWPHAYIIAGRDAELFHQVLRRMENGRSGDAQLDAATLRRVEEEFVHFNLTVPEVPLAHTHTHTHTYTHTDARRERLVGVSW